MKKVLCTVLAVVMAVVCFAGCSAPAAEGGNETGGSAASGDTIKVAFDINRLHIFDKDTEVCVVH